jgi:hypothetical protein
LLLLLLLLLEYSRKWKMVKKEKTDNLILFELGLVSQLAMLFALLFQ